MLHSPAACAVVLIVPSDTVFLALSFAVTSGIAAHEARIGQ